MIHVHVHTKKTTTPGPILAMDCPHCGARGTEADTADVVAEELLFGLIPVGTTDWTTITCRKCGRSFRSQKCCAELRAMTPVQISEFVARAGMSYVSNIVKIYIVASMIVPGLGVIFAIVGVVGTRGCRSHWRTAAYIGLVFSIVFAAWIILGAIYNWLVGMARSGDV
jgi:predicted nucleic-acid-binding Zn-ribbon protein